MNTKEYISSGIIESYVLGFASPEEAGILECVIKNNAEVRAAFEEAQKTLEDLATVQVVTAPEGLKSKIWNKIQNEQSLAEHDTVISTEIPIEKNHKEIVQQNNAWKTFAIAASVLFLISIGGNLFWMNDQSKNKAEIVKLTTEKQSQNIAFQKIQQKWNMMANPDMQMVMMKGVEKHPDSKAMVFWNKKTKNVYLNAESLPQAPNGKQYQLWAIVGGKPVSAGMYTKEIDSKIALSNIPQAQAFAITLEKQGGSDVPTMENIYVIGEI